MAAGMASIDIEHVDVNDVNENDDTGLEGECWGRQPLSNLKGSALEWSTVVETSDRSKSTKLKQCLFCGFHYTGGPFQIRAHLDPSVKPRTIRLCVPSEQWQWRDRKAEVLVELRRRRSVNEEEEAKKLKLEAAKAEGRAIAGFQQASLLDRVGTDEVSEAWMRFVVKRALPLDIFDDCAFRKAVAVTAAAGRKIIVQGDDTFLPRRNYMARKVLPALDAKLDDCVRKKVQMVAESTGVVLISDGWTSVENRPIINCLAALPVGSYFLAATDTSGHTKDAQYIADFVVDHIRKFGCEHVVAVCMDGACKASFPIIEASFPTVFTYICPTHSLDNFVKNVCSNKEIVRIKGIEGDFDWDESFFSEALEKVWEVVKFVCGHQKALARYRELGAEVPKESRPKGGLELLRYCETRFASKVLMADRYSKCHFLLEKLVIDETYVSWLSKQSRDIKEKGAEAKRIIRCDATCAAINVCLKALLPVVRLLRMTDAKLGATLGKVYGYMLQLDVLFRAPIDGMPERMRKKLHAIFMARWEYFHVPVMTAAFRFDPEFCRRDFDANEMRDLKQVLKQMATPAHSYPALLAQLADFEEALSSGAHDLNNEVAFSEQAKKMPSYKWARIYLCCWPDLCWATMRLLAMNCSASGCETSWSVEGWIHSKKRNRLGQLTVERLVRAHTNLLLEEVLEDWESAVLPWELEMVIDEPDE